MYLNPWAQPSGREPNSTKLSLSQSPSLSQYPLSFLSLVGFSEGLKAQYLQVYPIYSSPSLFLGSSGV